VLTDFTSILDRIVAKGMAVTTPSALFGLTR